MQPQKNIPSPDSDLPLLAAIKVKASSPRYRHATDTPTAGAQRRIGIAVDLSDESAFAVKWAVHHYLRPGDAVILLLVRPTSVLYGADWGSVDGSGEESHKKLEDEFHNFTTTKASDLSQPLVIAHIPFKIHIVKDHDMKERLCSEVERLGLSAVIMGSRGFGATKRGSSGRLGSVSDYCVRHCVCPVVVVRYPDEKDGSGAGADAGEPLGNMAAVAEVEDEPGKQDADAAEDHKGKGPAGVCMMSNTWRDEQHPSFINFISSFLRSNSFRLNFVPIAPDFIFNCGGLSVAFIFVTDWRSNNTTTVFSRIQKLKGQFAHIYVVVVLPTAEQNDSFIHCYFKWGMELGRPTFIPVQDLEMGFEKIVKLAHARGVCKRQDVISKLKADRERSVQAMNIFLKLVTSIPGIQNHDANALYQAIGSVEAIAKSSKQSILENTDLSAEKADTITRFFRDPKFYLSPKFS